MLHYRYTVVTRDDARSVFTRGVVHMSEEHTNDEAYIHHAIMQQVLKLVQMASLSEVMGLYEVDDYQATACQACAHAAPDSDPQHAQCPHGCCHEGCVFCCD